MFMQINEADILFSVTNFQKTKDNAINHITSLTKPSLRLNRDSLAYEGSQ